MINRRRFIKKAVMSGIVATTPSLLISKNNIPLTSSPRDKKTGQLYVWWSVADITPKNPVALTGNMGKTISEAVMDPLTATVLALETNNGTKEQAIMISCDLLFIRRQTQQKLQSIVKKELPDFDHTKLFLNAIHTHAGPGVIDGEFWDVRCSNDEGVMKPSEYEEFMIKQVSDAVIKAWKNKKGGFHGGSGTRCWDITEERFNLTVLPGCTG